MQQAVSDTRGASRNVQSISCREEERIRLVLLVSYYAAAQYLTPSSGAIERFSPAYFALVVPAWLYIFSNWRHLVSGYSTTSALMGAFAALAGVAGLLRGDWSLVYNACFLAGIAVVILNAGVHLTLPELNRIFLGCVVGSVLVYVVGITGYGFLPGQASADSCHLSMNWRVSLFRVTAESAMLSLFVLIANTAYGGRPKSWMRCAVMALAAYFLVFSGVRSVVAAALLVLPWCAVAALRGLPAAARQRAVLVIAVVTLLILSVPLVRGDSFLQFWKNYALRTEDCGYIAKYGAAEKTVPRMDTGTGMGALGVPTDWLGSTLNRHCAARYQLVLAATHPIGTDAVQFQPDAVPSVAGCSASDVHRYCLNCTFPTYWLARAGLMAVPLLLAFLVLLFRAVATRRASLALFLTACGIVSFGWGVMYVPYNVIFLIMMTMPALDAAYQRNERRT